MAAGIGRPCSSRAETSSSSSRRETNRRSLFAARSAFSSAARAERPTASSRPARSRRVRVDSLPRGVDADAGLVFLDRPQAAVVLPLPAVVRPAGGGDDEVDQRLKVRERSARQTRVGIPGAVTADEGVAAVDGDPVQRDAGGLGGPRVELGLRDLGQQGLAVGGVGGDRGGGTELAGGEPGGDAVGVGLSGGAESRGGEQRENPGGAAETAEHGALPRNDVRAGSPRPPEFPSRNENRRPRGGNRPPTVTVGSPAAGVKTRRPAPGEP